MRVFGQTKFFLFYKPSWDLVWQMIYCVNITMALTYQGKISLFEIWELVRHKIYYNKKYFYLRFEKWQGTIFTISILLWSHPIREKIYLRFEICYGSKISLNICVTQDLLYQYYYCLYLLMQNIFIWDLIIGETV